jgi:hypothetical protein
MLVSLETKTHRMYMRCYLKTSLQSYRKAVLFVQQQHTPYHKSNATMNQAPDLLS